MEICNFLNLLIKLLNLITPKNYHHPHPEKGSKFSENRSPTINKNRTTHRSFCGLLTQLGKAHSEKLFALLARALFHCQKTDKMRNMSNEPGSDFWGRNLVCVCGRFGRCRIYERG